MDRQRIIIMLLALLVFGIVGKFVGDDVTEVLRLRRKASRRKSEQALTVAVISNSYYGIYKGLVV